MEFAGIGIQRDRLRERIQARIARVLDHGAFVRGPEVGELESRLAAFAGVGHCVSCANGTDALHIALRGLGIGPGDEVVVPAFSFFATVEAVVLAGARPVFADVELDGFTIDPRSVEAALGARTRAIIPVSLFGQCADMDRIAALAAPLGVVVIEDAAQSFGALRRGRRSCALSRVACTSFFPSKPLGCYGDGGAIFTSDAGLAEAFALIANHGQRQRYVHERVGMNSRLDTIQAAVLLEKLEVFEQEIEHRATVAAWYREALEGSAMVLPVVLEGNTSVWAQYTIRVAGRERIAAALASEGIPTAVHYPQPLSRQPACAADVAVPAAEEAARTVLSLPMHGYLARGDVQRVAARLRALLAV